MSNGIKNRVGQYRYADSALRKRKIGGKLYLVGIAGAYDAFGLIGPEHNGIFILNDTDKCVVADQGCIESSGYNGPSQRQWDSLKVLMQSSDKQFIELVKAMPRYRGAM